MDPLLTDILDQPRALRAALEGASRRPPLPGGPILLCGMGASHFAAYPAFLRLLAAGAPVAWIEAGELLHAAPAALRPGTTAVLVSQSGRSAEIVRLLRARGAARVVGVTNDPGSPLGREADLTVDLDVGPEQAGVATKTFTASLLALDLLAGGDPARWPPLIDALQGVLESRGTWLPPLLEALQPSAHVFVLGRGRALAAALTTGLMLKEAAAVHGEGLSVPQFRHGPLELAGPGRSALVFVTPGEAGAFDLELAAEMAAAGMGVAAAGTGDQPVPPGVRAIPAGPADPAVLIAIGQCLAHAFAQRRGIVPGSFARVAKVTTRQ